MLSGLNNRNKDKDFLAGRDVESISAALKLSCQTHPLEQFAGAVLDLAKQLKQRRLPSGPPEVEESAASRRNRQ